MRQKYAITLSLHGSYLFSSKSNFNKVTGLPRKPYSRNQVDDFGKETSHSVAIVGFDDALAAFIIRNTWNDSDEILGIANPTISKQELQDLQKMRLKISAQILPGYYAIPYDYVQDLIANERGSFSVISIDWLSYNNQYQYFKNGYQTVLIPYTCSIDYEARKLLRYKDFKQKTLNKSLPKHERDEARTAILQLLTNPSQFTEAYWDINYIKAYSVQ